MTVYEVDVRGSPVTVRGRGDRVVAEGMGLEITSAEVELVEPGLLAVRSRKLEVEERGNKVRIHGIGSSDLGGGGLGGML